MEDFRDRFLEFTKVSRVCSKQEITECRSLSAALCDYLDAKAESLLVDGQSSPVMMCYLADGWGATCRSTVKSSSPCEKKHKVCRKGKYRYEFLLERGILRVLAGDGASKVASGNVHFYVHPPLFKSALA